MGADRMARALRVKGDGARRGRWKKGGAGAVWRRALSFLFPAAVLLLLFLREPTGYALFLVSALLLHEAGHCFAFFLLGEPPPALSGRLGGLLLSPRGGALSYGRELIVALAGPLFNLLAAAALIPAIRGGAGKEASFCFFAINLLSALFNLLPLAGFDGGRVLFCLFAMLLSPRVARVLSEVISGIFLLLFYFCSLFLFLFSDGFGYSFPLSLLLLLCEGRRTGILFRDFGSICKKN